MAVTHQRSLNPNDPGSKQCVICRERFHARRFDALYCSSACTQKAYRRRQAEKKLEAARKRRRDDEHKHRTEWRRFFINNGCGNATADRLYVALTAMGRLHDLPWEQTQFAT